MEFYFKRRSFCRCRQLNRCIDCLALKRGSKGMSLHFIADRYGAAILLHLPPHIAKEGLIRPADFNQAAKSCCEPEFSFWEKLKTEMLKLNRGGVKGKTNG